MSLDACDSFGGVFALTEAGNEILQFFHFLIGGFEGFMVGIFSILGGLLSQLRFARLVLLLLLLPFALLFLLALLVVVLLVVLFLIVFLLLFAVLLVLVALLVAAAAVVLLVFAVAFVAVVALVAFLFVFSVTFGGCGAVRLACRHAQVSERDGQQGRDEDGKALDSGHIARKAQEARKRKRKKNKSQGKAAATRGEGRRGRVRVCM
mmetsp:Transcript_95353/g.199480  ORF Transcript_95353/g.199480 Transcript_95353/m.199480 type:complete len:207 (+) Transcript_95353:1183-1803(+)